MELYEAYAIGKHDGISTAESILAVAISRVIEHYPTTNLAILRDVRAEFKAECARYKADINKPVTEEEKKQLLNN